MFKTYLFKESIDVVVLLFMIMFIFKEYNVVFIPCLITLIILIYLYRLPIRKKRRYDDRIIVSPSDGTVIDIQEDKEIMMYKISIHLSLFDTHFQWFPVDGVVKRIIYKPGEFDRDTFLLPSTTDRNEKMITILENEHGMVRVDQIAGQIARRIVNWTISNSYVKRGNLLGFIKMSSQVDLYLPSKNTELFVDVNDKLTGKITPIGRWK